MPDDDRSASERRADALVELAVRQLQSGELPSVHGERPHLVVTTGDAASAGFEAAAAEMAHAGPSPLRRRVASRATHR
ncbi:MAG: DUF222 domain-containing protein [Candidatus Dormibacteraeota bacterium]|nr:DUF222 domain-containing protein [Candidatus Dormibacteraeota bacterium]MBV9526027.1 DUF222 domain-containing protein [Candidatus Dormibacteraeota bacterium]